MHYHTAHAGKGHLIYERMHNSSCIVMSRSQLFPINARYCALWFIMHTHIIRDVMLSRSL